MRAQAPGLRHLGSPSAAGKVSPAAPGAVSGGLRSSQLMGLTDNAGASGLGADRPRSKQGESPAAHHALGSGREAARGRRRRDKSQQPQGHCFAVCAGSRTRGTGTRRGPSLSAARLHDVTTECSRRLSEKKIFRRWDRRGQREGAELRARSTLWGVGKEHSSVLDCCRMNVAQVEKTRLKSCGLQRRLPALSSGSRRCLSCVTKV